MTLKEMRDKVVLDANVLGDEMFPIARLNEIINQANRAVQIKLNGTGLKAWETSEDYSALNDDTFHNYNVTQCAIPTNFLEGDNFIFAETVSSTINGVAYEVTYAKFPELLKNSYSRPTEQKPSFTRIENTLFIFPRVTTFNLYYRKIVDTLVNDSDVSEIPLEYHDLVVAKAVMEIKKDKNDQMYLADKQKLDKNIEEVQVVKQRNKQEKLNDSTRN